LTPDYENKLIMKIIKKLFGSKKKDVFSEVPEGICPNCWGDQEYGNIIRDKFKDQQIPVNNHDSTAQYAFIQEFIVTHLKGIKLKSYVHGMECEHCRVVYKEDKASK